MKSKKKMKKIFKGAGAAVLSLSLAGMLAACSGEYTRDKSDEWKEKFDLSVPVLTDAGSTQETANADGWYLTLSEDFDGDTLPSMFVPSPHGLRNTEYWCDQMVSVQDGCAVIEARHDTDHDCAVCGEKEGDFTSGIETRQMVDGQSVPLFEQAFGYFEARVRFPQSGGMWSAFWLQSDSEGQIGNEGEDGTEIDIYESSFYNTDRNEMGHALHYDGYDPKTHRCMDTIRDAGTDLYEGWHTFALKWTPTEYVFYIDGQVSWASDFGGVSKVPAYLRFTNEIRPGKTGPYGQRLGDFDGGTLYVDWVHVYQNVDYLDDIRSADDFSENS